MATRRVPIYDPDVHTVIGYQDVEEEPGPVMPAQPSVLRYRDPEDPGRYVERTIPPPNRDIYLPPPASATPPRPHASASGPAAASPSPLAQAALGMGDVQQADRAYRAAPPPAAPALPRPTPEPSAMSGIAARAFRPTGEFGESTPDVSLAGFESRQRARDLMGEAQAGRLASIQQDDEARGDPMSKIAKAALAERAWEQAQPIGEMSHIFAERSGQPVKSSVIGQRLVGGISNADAAQLEKEHIEQAGRVAAAEAPINAKGRAAENAVNTYWNYQRSLIERMPNLSPEHKASVIAALEQQRAAQIKLYRLQAVLPADAGQYLSDDGGMPSGAR